MSFTYPFQKTQALTQFNLSLKVGEKVGLVGRNGSGKSTIEKLLLNLYSPTEGSILIDQTDLRQIDPADLRSNIGYVPQDIYLFNGSVRDNITFGMSGITDEDILRAAMSSGAHDFIRQHPMGYDMPVGEGGSSLSGGQRQSIALARALIRNASIIVLDEPTAMIDNTAEAQLIQRLKPIIKDKTVFIISHRLPLLDLVDRIVVLDEGKIVADGPKQDVLRALSNSQIRSAG